MTLGSWMHGGEVATSDLDALRAKLYFDLVPGRVAYVRFGILLLLSVIIATGGVIADSTATVIGAMIVAPLMTPIMATALAVVTGDAERMGRSFAIVLIGVAGAIGLSWLILSAGLETVDLTTNSQVTGRTNPQLVDMMVALASGAAGAFALSREDVGDTLPGVAISISLVPPLCVVGVALAEGSWDAASGAFLLFSTNLMAILVAGGLLLGGMGYGRVALERADRRRKRRAVVMIVVGTVAILVPLAVTTVQTTREYLLTQRAESNATSWLAGSDTWDLVAVEADGGGVEIIITGDADVEPPPSVDDLRAEFAPDVPEPLVVRELPSRTLVPGSDDPGDDDGGLSDQGS